MSRRDQAIAVALVAVITVCGVVLWMTLATASDRHRITQADRDACTSAANSTDLAIYAASLGADARNFYTITTSLPPLFGQVSPWLRDDLRRLVDAARQDERIGDFGGHHVGAAQRRLNADCRFS